MDGPHVGYSRVEEINAGKTVYFFRNEASGGPLSHSNGDLVGKEIYDDSNNLLEKTDYTYWVDGSTGPLPNLYSMAAEPKPAQDNKTLLCFNGSIYEWRQQCCASGAGTTGCVDFFTFYSKLERKYASIKRRKKLVTKEVMTYNSKPYTTTQNSLVKKVEYKYDDANIFKPTEIKILDASNTEISKTIHRYPTIAGTGVPQGMVISRIFSDPVESQYYIKGVHVYSTKKDFNTSLPYIPKIFYEKLGSETTYSTLETANSIDLYGNYNSVSRLYDVPNSYIWTGDRSRLAAVVKNASTNEIAFTSFDAPYTYQGGWQVSVANDIKYSVGASGSGYYLASASRTINSPLLANGKYIISYYTKNTASVTLNTSNLSILKSTSQVPLSNGWIYVEHIINKTASGNCIVNLASGAYLDELRVYPADALMQTVSYDRDRYLPECIGDVSGMLNRFEYDDLNRLIILRNSNDEIVRTFEYYYKSVADNNNYNGIYNRIIQKSNVLTMASAQALTGSNVQRSIDYFDGLGRNDQSVGIDLSPLSRETVMFYLYDGFGRQARSYLPYTFAGSNTTLNNVYHTTATSSQSLFYGTDGAYAFTEQHLETSPLSRPKGVKSPGVSWNNKPTAISYEFNTANEVRNPLVASQFYAANTLFKVKATDEDGKITLTYSDLLGRKVMESMGGLKTYYIYDGYGNITQVIQPEGSKLLHSSTANINTTSTVKNKSFVYTYDTRFRLISKTVPGTNNAFPYAYNYDRLDRLVLVKDPNGFKTFTKYDILSRPILTGKYYGTSIPTNTDGLFEEKPGIGALFYSNNKAFPINQTEIYTVNYYDDYDYDVDYVDNISYNPPIIPPGLGNYSAPAYTAVRGKPTGQNVGVLNTSGAAPTLFICTIPIYDIYGRVIYTKEDHPFSGSDETWTEYHFSGWPLRTRLQHSANIGGSSKNYTINYRMTYDHAGRRKQTYHRIGDTGTEYEISSKTYNERDELSQNIIGGSQAMDYTYNIRKWLTDINDVNNCSSPDLFSMKLNYDVGNSSILSNALYNGNISSIEWRTGANCTVNSIVRNKAAYGFTYDSANRITRAKYGEYNSSNVWQSGSLDRYTVDGITYDDNGNLKTLRRKGLTGTNAYGFIDNLTYSYNSVLSNQLSTISESSLITKGFKKVSSTASGYTYDNNGNVNADGYRGITGTTSNYLNLPSKITYSSTKYIEYTYDASGRKWKMKTVNGATVTEKTYIGSIEYNGTNLEAIYHEEGRAVPTVSAYEYQYNLKDHLGNNRVVFKLVGTTATLIQEGHYYPFGMEMEGFVTGENRYRYNGKELDTDFGLNYYHYGARMYDASVGRFTGVDPLAEKFPFVTTFNYAENKPINGVDLGGLQYLDAQTKMEIDRKASRIDFKGKLDVSVKVINLTSSTPNDDSKAFHQQMSSRAFDNVNMIQLNEKLPLDPETGKPSGKEFNIYAQLNIDFKLEKSKSGLEGITKGDVVLILVDDLKDNNVAAITDRSGYAVIMEKKAFEMKNNIVTHEFGHLIGDLLDRKAPPKNLMAHPIGDNFNLEVKQYRNIIENLIYRRAFNKNGSIGDENHDTKNDAEELIRLHKGN